MVSSVVVVVVVVVVAVDNGDVENVEKARHPHHGRGATSDFGDATWLKRALGPEESHHHRIVGDLK